MPLSSASSIGIFTLELAVYQLSLAGTLQFVSPRFLSLPPVVQFVNYAFTILSLVQLAVSTALLFSAAEVRGTLRRGYLCGVSQGFAVLFLLLWACAFVAQWFGFPRVASTSAPTSYGRRAPKCTHASISNAAATLRGNFGRQASGS